MFKPIKRHGKAKGKAKAIIPNPPLPWEVIEFRYKYQLAYITKAIKPPSMMYLTFGFFMFSIFKMMLNSAKIIYQKYLIFDYL